MYTSVIPTITAFKYLRGGKLYIKCKLLLHIIIIIIILLLLFYIFLLLFLLLYLLLTVISIQFSDLKKIEIVIFHLNIIIYTRYNFFQYIIIIIICIVSACACGRYSVTLSV